MRSSVHGPAFSLHRDMVFAEFMLKDQDKDKDKGYSTGDEATTEEAWPFMKLERVVSEVSSQLCSRPL